MRKVILLLMSAALGSAWAAGDAAAEVVALERRAMDGWLKGDPEPQLAITDPGIIFIHDVVGQRLDGLAAVKTLYEQYRGMPLFDRYEMLGPKTQVSGDVVVLIYQLAQSRGGTTAYWNGTQVYQRKPGGWRVVHTHWSAAKEKQP